MTSVTHRPIHCLCIVCDKPMLGRLEPHTVAHPGSDRTRSCYNNKDKVIANLLEERVCAWCGGPLDKLDPPSIVCCNRQCYRNRRNALNRGYIVGVCPRCGENDAYYTSGTELSCAACGYYTIGGAQPADIVGMVTPSKVGKYRRLSQRLDEGGHQVLSMTNINRDSGGALGERNRRVEEAARKESRMWTELMRR